MCSNKFYIGFVLILDYFTVNDDVVVINSNSGSSSSESDNEHSLLSDQTENVPEKNGNGNDKSNYKN